MPLRDESLALAKAQSLLGRRNSEAVGVREVIEQILEPFGLHDRRASHFFIAGDNVRLPPKAAITLAVVFHELATNAVKYGALAAEDTGGLKLHGKLRPLRRRPAATPLAGKRGSTSCAA